MRPPPLARAPAPAQTRRLRKVAAEPVTVVCPSLSVHVCAHDLFLLLA